MRRTVTTSAWSLAATVVVCGLAWAGCNPGPQPKPIAELTPQENHGRLIFAQRCAMCHSDRNDAAEQGPTMVALYKHQYLPSGAPANDERVASTIHHGRGMMPRQPDIQNDNLADLLAYLHTL